MHTTGITEAVIVAFVNKRDRDMRDKPCLILSLEHVCHAMSIRL